VLARPLEQRAAFLAEASYPSMTWPEVPVLRTDESPQDGQLRVELKGNLAAMLTAAQKTKRSPETGDLLVPIQMVAGGGFEPPTFGL
jgi:hypothetical protein